MTYDEITALIDDFRAETTTDSITPDVLGQLIQKILDYASDEGVIAQGLVDLIATRDEALAAIEEAQTTAETEIETTESDALNAISTAIQGIDVTYETLSGTDPRNIQLKNGDGDAMMPKTTAEMVNVDINSKDVQLSSRLDQIKYNGKVDLSLISLTGGLITISNKWNGGSGNYNSKCVDVKNYRGMNILILNKSTYTSYYAFLRSTNYTVNALQDYCTGCSLVTIGANADLSVKIPSDANYIYLLVQTVGLDVPLEVSFFDNTDPSTVAKSINGVIGDVSPKVTDVIYPINYQGGAGFLRDDITNTNYGQFVANSTYRGTFIPFSQYRGRHIRLYLSQKSKDLASQSASDFRMSRYAFTKSAPTANTSSSILCANTIYRKVYGNQNNIPDYVDDYVPNDCNYLFNYGWNGSWSVTAEMMEKIEILDDGVDAILSDISIESNKNILSDEDEMNDGNVDVERVFSHYFPNIESDDELNGLDNATVTSSGITLTAGVSTPITHSKLFVFDDEEITLDVDASSTDKILLYCCNNKTGEFGVDTTEATYDTESYALFDFTNGTFSIYEALTVDSSTGLGTAIVSGEFVVQTGKYRLSIGRKRRDVFAKIYNYTTRVNVEIVCSELNVYSLQVNKQVRPAGWMYRYPSFLTIAGTPNYVKFSAYAKTNLNMLFQGDSYTQGYAGVYQNCWAYNSAVYFKNSRTCGISGAVLNTMIQQYHESIKGKIKVKNMVITIGINDMSSLTTDALIATWASTFKDYLDELVADGINPIVNRIWQEGSANATTATRAQKMNNYIRSFGYDGADFNRITGATSDSTYYYEGHLSPNGNHLSYEIFIKELAHYKQD